MSVDTKMTQAELLVKIADLAEVFRGPDGETAYATVDVGLHRETWAVKGAGFKRWLRGQFYAAEQKPPGGQALADAIGVIDARALFTSKILPVHTRVAATETAVYHDLANMHWQAAEITTSGWAIIDPVPVKFRRSRGMLPLPSPVPGGSVEDLHRFLNVKDERDWALVVGWLLAALRGTGPFPVLAIGGEHGSGKSSVAKVLRALIDPNQSLLRSEPRDARDLAISARHGYVIVLDNLSSIQSWLSDCLCRLATGGGFSTRELYTDDDEIIFDAKRPVIINGIESIIERSDLLDRALLLDLPVIAEDDRRREKDFWADFHEVAPAILGALLSAVSTSLARESSVKLARLPRMADFAIQVTAAAPAFGWGENQFLLAYTDNRDKAHETVVDDSLIASAVRALVGPDTAGTWSGTASELLAEVNGRVDESARKERWWPKTPKTLAGHVRRLSPNLRALGIDVRFVRDPDKRRTRRMTITWTEVAKHRPNSPNGPSSRGPSDAANAEGRLSDAATDEAEEQSDARLNAPGSLNSDETTGPLDRVDAADTKMAPPSEEETLL